MNNIWGALVHVVFARSWLQLGTLFDCQYENYVDISSINTLQYCFNKLFSMYCVAVWIVNIMTILVHYSLQLLNSFFTKWVLFSTMTFYMSNLFSPWQLELKLGLGGTSYEDFIRSMHLPLQLRFLLTFNLSVIHKFRIQSKLTFVLLNCKKLLDWHPKVLLLNSECVQSGWSHCGFLFWWGSGCYFSLDVNWSQQCWATREEKMQILLWNWYVSFGSWTFASYMYVENFLKSELL